MSNTFVLTKILLKGMFSFGDSKKGKKNKIFALMLILLLGICFVPFAIQAKELSFFLGKEGTSLMVEMLVVLNTLLLLIISLMSNIGVVFFSKDNDVLLHMPIKPREIFFARNIVVLVSCYFLTLLMFLPSAIGAGIGIDAGTSYYIFVVLVTVLLPIMPCFISSLITLLIIRYIKFIKNKDLMTYLTTIVALIVGIGFSFSMEYLMPVVDETTDIFALINNYKIFINNLGWVFPYSIPLMKLLSISTEIIFKFIYLFGFSGICAFLVYFSGFLADKIYFSALLRINGFGTKKKQFNELEFRKKTSDNSLNSVLIKRELKVIFRTPMYLLNLILPVIFPLSIMFVLMPIVNDLSGNDLMTISYFIKDYVLEGIILIALICCFGNFSSPVMYSKDGNTNKSINYLPIPFMKSFLIKTLVSSFISIIPYICLVICGQLILKFEIVDIIFPICLGLLIIIAVNFLGTFIDLNRPKIRWNNEAEAVKNNLNVFIYMILLIIYVGVAFVLKEYAIILSILTIGSVIALVYRNETKYIDKLS